MSDVRVHPTAIVEDGARIGPGASVWHHAHVRAGAVIGAGSVIGKNCYIDADAVVGARCKVQNNVSVYSGVTLADDVFVGPSVVFTNDRFPRAFGAWEIVPTVVGRGASIGANATLRCGIEIGELGLVAAGAVVTRDVRPNELVGGNPARTMGWVDVHGTVVSRDAERPDSLPFGGFDAEENIS